MTTTQCVECGTTFVVTRRRGIPQATCSEACRDERQRRNARDRAQRSRERRMARETPPSSLSGRM